MIFLFSIFIISIPTLIVILNYKKVVEYFSTIHKNLLTYVLFPVSFTILFTNYNRTVTYRETTPSWEYYHDPFWFTFLFQFHTLLYLFIGIVISILLTVLIRKIIMN
jgi:hypothetical protein